MACFLAPAAAAVITTGFRKKIPEYYHIGWLNSMLWGGVMMLAVEHITHGEIIFYPPFLTAIKNPANTWIMLTEIVHVGGPMLLAIFTAWTVLVVISNFNSKKYTGEKIINQA